MSYPFREGIMALSVPVVRGSFHKVPINELKIDYSKNWQRLHLRALSAAYNSSAFFEFYEDDIERLIMEEHELLVEKNSDILKFLTEMIETGTSLATTESYFQSYPGSFDCRYSITPKNRKIRTQEGEPEYFQVFGIGNGFIPDLSILDLLFNLGPESAIWLRSGNPA
ncbi:MAG: WbqC family protein [Bacteroidales bacterium]